MTAVADRDDDALAGPPPASLLPPTAPGAEPAPAAVSAPPTPPRIGPPSAPPPPSGGGRWDRGSGPSRGRGGSFDGARVVGIVFILAGLWLLIRRFVPLDGELVWPLIAIVVGGLLVVSGLRPRGRNG